MILRHSRRPVVAIVMVYVMLFGSLLGPPFQSVAHAGHYSWDQGHDTTGPNNPPPPKDPPDPPCNACGCALSPVYLAAGNLVRAFTDIQFPTVGEPIALTRTYNSQDDRSGPFGKGWTFNLGMQALPVTDGVTDSGIVRTASGQRFCFEGGAPPPGRQETLTENPDGTLTLEYPGRLQLNFDDSGRLLEQIDPNGNAVSFQYDPVVGVLQSVTDDASGRRIDLVLGPDGKFASATDPMGNVYSYGYDLEGRLVSVTDPLGNTTQYEYDSLDRLTRIVDPRGVEPLTAAYDSEDRVDSYSEFGVGVTVEYSGGQTIKRDSAGNATTYDLTPDGLITRITDPLGNTAVRTFDAEFNVASQTDPGGATTTFGYDADGNVVSITDHAGNVLTRTYDPVLDRITSQTDPLGVVTQWSYDPAGNLLQTTYDAGGALQAVVQSTYDAFGQTLSQTDGNGNVTTATYDTRGNRISTTDPLGNTWNRTFDDMGRVLTETDPLGRVSSFEYDALGRLTAANGPLGGRTELSWDTSGNLTSVTDALGNATVLVYDTRNLVTSVTDALGGVTTRTYHPRNNLLATVTDAEGSIVAYGYDAANNLTSLTDPLGRVTQYVIDAFGLATRVTAADGSELNVVYNFQRLPVAVTDALGNTTNHAYDARGLRTSTTDAGGHTTAFTYDRLGRLASITDPLGRSWTFVHDSLANLVSRTDPKGQTILFVYDGLRRLVTTMYPDGTSVDRSYDAVGNLLTLSNPLTTLQLSYDARNRLQQLSDSNLGKSVTYSYDLLDRRSAMTTPEGTATSYVYDALSRLTQVTRGAETTVHTYNADSTRATTTLANGTTKTWAYDGANQVTAITHRRSDASVLQSFAYSYDAAGNVTQVVRESGDTVSYTYDANHRLTAEERVGLVSYSHEYAYDAVGNRLSFGSGCAAGACAETTTYGYDAADQLLQEVRPTAVLDHTYDANGNLISRFDGTQIVDFDYDFENRIVSIDAPGTAADAAYAYDGDGKRAQTTVGGLTRRFFYERADDFYFRSPLANSIAMLKSWLTGTNVLTEYDDLGALLKSYVNGLGLDEAISWSEAGATHYFLADRLSSVSGVVDGAQALVNEYEYSAFGVVESIQEDQANPYRFTGRRYDDESGFYYLRMRYYDPEVGRFQSRDPMQEGLLRSERMNEEISPLFSQVRQPHAYGYVEGQPTKTTDPTGTSLIVVCSLGLPVCSAAIFCSANVGACSGGLICSATVGACSFAVLCSATAVAGACSAGVACSGNAAGAVCSAAVICSGQTGVLGGSACSVSVMACSAQAGVLGGSACSLSATGGCSGQAGVIGGSACSANIAGACSGQVGAGVAVCSAQFAGACSAQYTLGGGWSACSGQIGGACSAQGGWAFKQLTPFPDFCSAQVDSNGQCCNVADVQEVPAERLADADRPIHWREVLSSLEADRSPGGEARLTWSVTPASHGGAYRVLRWTETTESWDKVSEGALRPGRLHEAADAAVGADGASYLLSLQIGGQKLDVGPFEVAPAADRDVGSTRTLASAWKWLTSALGLISLAVRL